MSELKVCPFCGGEAELYSAFIKKVAFVSCTKCGAALPMMAEAEAIEAWNTRHEKTCRPVRKEIEWPTQEGPRNRVVYECSECKAWIGITSSYCFNCGACITREDE